MQLLGDTRNILHELVYEERWHSTAVGISSRTHPPSWANELLSLFSIYDDQNKDDMLSVSMKEVFAPELCILDRDMDKASQFEVLLQRANDLLRGPTGNKRIQFKDAIFFDNEAGNCKQVARLGVTAVYTPKGLTRDAWENGLANFPYSNGVLGPKLPY